VKTITLSRVTAGRRIGVRVQARPVTLTLLKPLRSVLAHFGLVDVALASVITSGVLGLGNLWTAVWTTRKNVQIAREQRVQQRLGEGYLERSRSRKAGTCPRLSGILADSS
jgi:hypothetical protein